MKPASEELAAERDMYIIGPTIYVDVAGSIVRASDGIGSVAGLYPAVGWKSKLDIVLDNFLTLSTDVTRSSVVAERPPTLSRNSCGGNPVVVGSANETECLPAPPTESITIAT